VGDQTMEPGKTGSSRRGPQQTQLAAGDHAVPGCGGGGDVLYQRSRTSGFCSDDAPFSDPHANGGWYSGSRPVGMLSSACARRVLRWALLGNRNGHSGDPRDTARAVTEGSAPRRTVAHGRLPGSGRSLHGAPRPLGTVRAIWGKR